MCARCDVRSFPALSRDAILTDTGGGFDGVAFLENEVDFCSVHAGEANHAAGILEYSRA